MSELCMYSCGNYTDEPDGVCIACKGYSTKSDEQNNNVGANDDSPEQNNGGDKMAGHKKCSILECNKQSWKDGMCFKHYFKAHPKEKKPTAKAAKKVKKHNPSPPPLTLSGGEPIKCRCDLKPTSLLKPLDNINELVARMTAKRDQLKFEIIKIDGALLTLKEMCGIDCPDPEFLRAE